MQNDFFAISDFFQNLSSPKMVYMTRTEITTILTNL